MTNQQVLWSMIEKAKPILFHSKQELRAVMSGRKTSVRLVIKPANPFKSSDYHQKDGLWINGYGDGSGEEAKGHIKDYSVGSCWIHTDSYLEKYARYHKGDYLYVREAWNRLPYGGKYIYRESESENIKSESGNIPSGKIEHIKYRPSVQMPKEAARTWLQVLDVKIERLQDISFKDCLKEGIGCEYDGNMTRKNFEKLWDSTLKKSDIDRYGWKANPWVYVVEFEKIDLEKLLDQQKEQVEIPMF